MSEPPIARVLVIDDNVEVAQMISMVLEHAGCEVEVALGADAAVTLVALPLDFDLIVCDVMLPGTSGPETIERLGHPLDATIFVSGYPRSYFVGSPNETPEAAAFVTKPFRPAELVSIVHDLLARRTD